MSGFQLTARSKGKIQSSRDRIDFAALKGIQCGEGAEGGKEREREISERRCVYSCLPNERVSRAITSQFVATIFPPYPLDDTSPVALNFNAGRGRKPAFALLHQTKEEIAKFPR